MPDDAGDTAMPHPNGASALSEETDNEHTSEITTIPSGDKNCSKITSNTRKRQDCYFNKSLEEIRKEALQASRGRMWNSEWGEEGPWGGTLQANGKLVGQQGGHCS